MKRALIVLLVIVGLLVVVLLVAPRFIPTDAYKTQLTDAVGKATGRTLTIGGDLRLSVFPRLELEARDVAFANAPGAADADMATLDRLQVQVKLLPLLRGEVEVDRLVLAEPDILLEVDATGRANWDLLAAGGGAAPEQPEGRAAGPGTSGGAGEQLQDIRLGDVRLANGRAVYRDARTGAEYRFTNIDLAVSLPHLDQELAVDGAVEWNARHVAFKLASTRPRALLEGHAAPVALEVASDLLALRYTGTVATSTPLRAEGDVDLDAPSVREVAAWVGQPLEMGGGGLGPLRITGTLDVTEGTVAFREAQLALDDMHATGDLSVETGSATPQVRGRLDVDMLDLTPYLPPPTDAASADAEETAAAASDAEPPADWSDAPIDLSALRAADANLALTVGGIRALDVEIGRGAVAVALTDGVLRADLTELELYGGRGTAQLVVDGSGPVGRFAETATIRGVAAEPLLTDALGIDWLIGTAELTVDVTATGRSERAIVESLGGMGSVKFTDGAITGINLAAMVRNVQTAFLDASAREAQQTDFAELSGTYQIANGVVQNADLLLLNPLLRLNGAGTVDIPNRTVDYRVVPKAVASTIGQGGEAAQRGIAVPVLVTGSWDDVRFRPDLRGMLEDTLTDPAGTAAAAEETIRGIKEGGAGGVEGVLRGLLQPPAAEEEEESAPAEAPAAPDPVETLRGLFKR